MKHIQEFFAKITKQKIKKIKIVNDGFTNKTYCLTLSNNKKMYMRIPKSKKNWSYEDEIYIMKKMNIKLVYANSDNGIIIREWIEGIIPNKKIVNNKKFIIEFKNVIVQMHKIPFSKHLIRHNLFDVFEKILIPKKYYERYKNLLNKYQSMPLCVSHNDLTPKNSLWIKNKFCPIDYEWTRINYHYWDIAHFIVHSQFTLKNIDFLIKIMHLSKEILFDFFYIVVCYGWQWALTIKDNKFKKKYVVKNKELTEKYYNSKFFS